MNKNIQERFVVMIDTLCNGNKSEFCRRIGRNTDAVKDIIGGRNTLPGFELLYSVLSSDLGISPNWLMLGVGPMLSADAEKSIAPSVNIDTIHTVNIGNWGELVNLLRERA